MKIAMAQLNPIVGDIRGNLQRMEDVWADCCRQQADLVIFPELFLTGYPPRDLLERPAFLERVDQAIQRIQDLTSGQPGCAVLFGAPQITGKKTGRGLYNAALLIADGHILLNQAKCLLPSYDVFDETRYFDAGKRVKPIVYKDMRLGITICEDAWNESELWKGAVGYDWDPVAEVAGQGIDLLINISASPYFLNKQEVRCRLMSKHARNHGVPVIYLNQVGGNDELIFDGQSIMVDTDGEILHALAAFGEEVRIVETGQEVAPAVCKKQDPMAELYDALVLGLRDYIHKCGFTRVILGLSGGIDSAVVACVAAEALGKENVLGVTMPSQYSSKGSVDDSLKLAANLGIECRTIPIENIFNSYLNSLQEQFAGYAPDITEENIQARIRGNILMALSNKYGSMVINTGNKSEMAVGYCTLYGDMCGGLSVLADVPKTVVYELSAYINQDREIIPAAIVEKAPSAELRPDQKDQDTLPPYPVLDAILNLYIEENRSAQQIIARGFDPETVRWVLKTVNHNEYKRRQAAPGLKVSTRAFGAGRRMPIAARAEI